MTAQTTTTTNPHPTLTATQARALLQALLHTTPPPPNPPRPSTSSLAPKATTTTRLPQHPRPRPQQMQMQMHTHTQNITIDASTRIMGHANTIYLSSSPSPAEQASRISEMTRAALASVSQGSVAVNIIVNAGVNVIGSKNAIVAGAGAKGAQVLARGGAESGCTSSTGNGGLGVGRKRAAEEPVEGEGNAAKKVRVDEGSMGV